MSLRVTFLGTSGAVPTAGRNPSAIHLKREGEEFLLDCGEGTQRQMMRFSTGFSISRIFLTHVHGDHVLGLPGLLQTLDFNDRVEPLTIHTPRGTAGNVRRLITALDTTPGFPLEIEEVRAGDAVHEGEAYEVRTFPTDHRTRSVGYALVESERKGRFDRERAEELGVPVGPAFGRLHAGESVELEDRVVEPEEVVGPPRPGRRVVYTGDTRPTDATLEAAAGADLLIHDATFGDDWAERARETGHSTAREAGELASEAGVERLALTHVSSRYAGDVSRLDREVREAFPGGEAFVAEDGRRIDVPYPE